METEDGRLSDGTVKTSKKGGKRTRALTAEEETRRREALKERLKEKLELEKRALKVVERLLEDSVSEDFLIHSASGSSGEEVILLARRLQEKDIEDPLAAQPEDPRSSQQHSTTVDLSHSDSSDIEQEQDFVSSVVSQRQGPRVHWGSLPKRTDEDNKGRRGKVERRKTQNQEEVEGHQSQYAEREGKLGDENRQESHPCETGVEVNAENPKQLLLLNTEKCNGDQVSEEMSLSEEPSVREATSKLNMCSLSEAPAAPRPVDSTPKQADLIVSLPCKDSNPSVEGEHLRCSTLMNSNQDSKKTALKSLNITQVGMSKRGAAGLRDLLKNHTAGAKADSIRLNLLESLSRTLKDWCTEETLKFLYGAVHSPGSPFTHVREEKELEELDEDDLDDEEAQGIDAGVLKRASAAAPDYRTLQKESQQLELRVKEFYKGTWILPKGSPGDGVTVQDQNVKYPVLPLVDSHSQQLIQKRITVEKLTSCLRNIVGPLRLTMSDISTDLNNLVRTFKFTNTNIIHKAPEWTLISIVLLSLLSEVSPLVREALEMPASVEYLNTLMEELSLQQQDLLDLVRVFKTPAL